MSQLESEFKVDIMILSDDIESNSKDEKILKEIDNQLDILREKINEVNKDVEEMKAKDINKPINEIAYWKNKSAKLTKAYKLINDERVKNIVNTIKFAADHRK